MESQTWICEYCQGNNENHLNTCQYCTMNRPNLIELERAVDVAVPLPKPIQLFANLNNTLHLVPNALEKISENFDKNKPITPVALAGMLGTGKSTWGSVIIYLHEKERFPITSRFDIGKHQNSQTQGIWCYPFPIILQDCPNTQILLLDLEGLGGLKEGDPNAVKMNIEKIFALGMIMSSAVVLMTNSRLHESLVTDLKRTLCPINKLLDKLSLSLPEIHLMFQECDEEPVTSTGVPILEYLGSLEAFVKEFDKEFLRSLKAVGRPSYPDGFLAALKQQNYHGNVFDLLQGQILLGFTMKFLKTIAGNVKKKSGFQEEMRINDFCNLVKELAGMINSSQYSTLFRQNLNEVYKIEFKNISEPLQQKFKQECEHIILTFPLQADLSELSQRLLTMKFSYKEKIMEQLKRTVSRDPETIPTLMDCVASFMASLNPHEFEVQFLAKQGNYKQTEFHKKLDAQEKAREGIESRLRQKEKEMSEKIASLTTENAQANQRFQEMYSTQLKEIQKTNEQQQHLLQKLTNSEQIERNQRGRFEEEKRQQDAVIHQHQTQVLNLQSQNAKLTTQINEHQGKITSLETEIRQIKACKTQNGLFSCTLEAGHLGMCKFPFNFAHSVLPGENFVLGASTGLATWSPNTINLSSLTTGTAPLLSPFLTLAANSMPNVTGASLDLSKLRLS